MIVYEQQRKFLTSSIGIGIFSVALLYFVLPEIALFSNAIATAIFCSILFYIVFKLIKKSYSRGKSKICKISPDHILFYQHEFVAQKFRIMFSEILACDIVKDEAASLDREDVYLMALKVRSTEKYSKYFDYRPKLVNIVPDALVPTFAKISSLEKKGYIVIPVFPTDPPLDEVRRFICKNIEAPVML